jgi:hypothetical protein
MSERTQPVLSVVVPLYNEAAGLREFYDSLTGVLKGLDLSYELVLVNDGSTDASAELVADIAKADPRVRTAGFSRNFGKELATTAGLHLARGQAIIVLDADGQHPVEAIPDFIIAWRQGAKVVVGRRTSRHATPYKRVGSWLFYGLYNRLTGIAVEPDVSLSISPLYATAYIGAVVLPLSTLLGLGMLGNYLLRDPLGLHATGGAYLMVLVLFLVGILLVSQGIIGLYLSHIHAETQNRPLYILDETQTKG